MPAAPVRALLTALALLAQPAWPEPSLPERFTATFEVLALGTPIGETRWELAPAGEGRFRLRAETTAAGLAALVLQSSRDEESVWEYADGRPRPLHYRQTRTGRKARVDEIAFDWARQVATSRSRDKTWSLPLAPGTLDGVVYVLALMQDLAAERPALAYTLADRGKVKSYDLTREATEEVTVGAGRFKAVRVSRTDEKGRRTRLWCAPALNYLPVQIEHTERTGTITLRLKTVEGIATRPRGGRE